jgi:hypothetical protein
MMKLVNRLLIIAVIAFGAWFLIQHWDSAELPVIENDGGEVVFEPVEGEDELVLDIESDLSLEEQLEALRTKSTTTLTSSKAPIKSVVSNGENPILETTKEIENDVVKAENSVVKVYLFDGGMDISTSVIPEGYVTFLVRNDGRMSHDFSVEGIQDFGRIVPGSVHTFELKVAEGEYVLFSPRELDQRLEMHETLRVEKAN